MRWAGLILLFLCAAGLSVRFIWLKEHVTLAQPTLSFEFEKTDYEVKQHDQNRTIPVGGVAELDQMRKKRAALCLEIMRRKYHGDALAVGGGLLGLALLAMSFRNSSGRNSFGKKTKGEKGKSAENRSLWETSVPEAVPREVYVDEREYERQSEGGFATRDEAVEWLLKDPLLKCDYCGKQLRPTGSVEREALELVTFYKKVPDGAKDLRIILGSLWFTRPASELKCSGCDRLVRR